MDCTLKSPSYTEAQAEWSAESLDTRSDDQTSVAPSLNMEAYTDAEQVEAILRPKDDKRNPRLGAERAYKMQRIHEQW